MFLIIFLFKIFATLYSFWRFIKAGTIFISNYESESLHSIFKLIQSDLITGGVLLAFVCFYNERNKI
jgi:hypothetical protein